MLTTDQINVVAKLAAAIKRITDREERTLAAAIARSSAREQKMLANTRLRYAQERGETKASASPEALRLHGIDLETDEDVRAWREAQGAAELVEELGAIPADPAGAKRRGA